MANASSASNASYPLAPPPPPASQIFGANGTNTTWLPPPSPPAPPVVPCCSMRDTLLIAIIGVSSINVLLFFCWLSSRCGRKPSRADGRASHRQDAAMAAAQMISAAVPPPPPMPEGPVSVEGRLNGRSVNVRIVQRGGPGARCQTDPMTAAGASRPGPSSDVLFFNEHEQVSPAGDPTQHAPPWRMERPFDNMPAEEGGRAHPDGRPR